MIPCNDCYSIIQWSLQFLTVELQILLTAVQRSPQECESWPKISLKEENIYKTHKPFFDKTDFITGTDRYKLCIMCQKFITIEESEVC